MKRVLLIMLLVPVFANAQIIITVSGNGTLGYGGDGGLATAAKLNYPVGVSIDGGGSLYIADYANHRIRKVSTSGVITTIAGNGTIGYSGDGGPATAAEIGMPYGVVVDNIGNIYFTDIYTFRIRKVNSLGIISTLAGNGGPFGYSGDGGPATTAGISIPYGITIDSRSNLYFADNANNCIRKIDTFGIISTVAGNDTAGYAGDGGQATNARLNSPLGVAFDNEGNMYIADANNFCIRKVNTTGIISTKAGNGTAGYAGDGGPATDAKLNGPAAIIVDSNGNLYIADQANNRIRKVSASGVIYTYAGNGVQGYSGDGGAAASAELYGPMALAIDYFGNLYIADEVNNRIRKVYDQTLLTNTIARTSLNLNIEPNPATTTLNVSASDNMTTVVITNLFGKTMYSRQFNSQQIQLDVADLPAGLYLIRINGSEVRKFVKE